MATSLLSAAPNFEAVTALGDRIGSLTPGLSLDPTQAFTDAPAQKDETQALRERVAELERSEARANEKMQMLEEELHAALDAGGGGTTTTPAAAKKTPMLTLPAAQTPSLQTPDANATTPPYHHNAIKDLISHIAAIYESMMSPTLEHGTAFSTENKRSLQRTEFTSFEN